MQLFEYFLPLLIGFIFGLFGLLINNAQQTFVIQVSLHLGAQRARPASFGGAISTAIYVALALIINLLLKEDSALYNMINALTIGFFIIIGVVYLFMKEPSREMLQSPGKRESVSAGFVKGMYDFKMLFFWMLLINTADFIGLLPEDTTLRLILALGAGLGEWVKLLAVTVIFSRLEDSNRARYISFGLDKLFGGTSFLIAIIIAVHWI